MDAALGLKTEFKTLPQHNTTLMATAQSLLRDLIGSESARQQLPTPGGAVWRDQPPGNIANHRTHEQQTAPSHPEHPIMKMSMNTRRAAANGPTKCHAECNVHMHKCVSTPGGGCPFACCLQQSSPGTLLWQQALTQRHMTNIVEGLCQQFQSTQATACRPCGRSASCKLHIGDCQISTTPSTNRSKAQR